MRLFATLTGIFLVNNSAPLVLVAKSIPVWKRVQSAKAGRVPWFKTSRGYGELNSIVGSVKEPMGADADCLSYGLTAFLPFWSFMLLWPSMGSAFYARLPRGSRRRDLRVL